MTVEEASRAVRVELRAEDSLSPDCHYVSPVEGAEGLSFMVVGGTIARIDVFQGDIKTRSGVGIGTREQQVMDSYPGQIEVSSHPYDETGHYLTFVPRDAAERAYRVIFETDGRAVTSFRSGRLPEVQAIEGCS